MTKAITRLLAGSTEVVAGDPPQPAPIDVASHEPTANEVSTAVALIRTDDEWADVADGDMTPSVEVPRIPMLTLNRKIDGGFVDDTGEILSEMDMVLLAKQNTRAFFEAPFGSKDASKMPDCWSGDAVVPDERSTKKMSETCASCPLSAWDEGDPPRCRESIVTLSFLPDNLGAGRFARIRWGGIAFAPIRDYWSSFRNRIPKRPPMAYVTHVRLEPFETDNGKFLKPVFVRAADLTRAEIEPVRLERDTRLAEFKALAASDARTDDRAGEAGPFDGPPTTVADSDGEPF